MSFQHHSDNRPPDPGAPLNAARLAHELANLLDGSLRNVRLVMDSLRDPSGRQVAPTGTDDDLLRRLETASIAMGQMARLIRRWLQGGDLPHRLFDDDQKVGEVVEHVVQLMTHEAQSRQVTLRCDMDDLAAILPAGPLYPILLNALRNSVAAVAERSDRLTGDGCVELALRVDDGHLLVTVTDNGRGLDTALLDDRGRYRLGQQPASAGRGFGLTLCHDIALGLGGSLHLANRAAGGAVFQFRVPVDRLAACVLARQHG